MARVSKEFETLILNLQTVSLTRINTRDPPDYPR
jgi:hypothetical protein